jgi:hypothetical protein
MLLKRKIIGCFVLIPKLDKVFFFAKRVFIVLGKQMKGKIIMVFENVVRLIENRIKNFELV